MTDYARPRIPYQVEPDYPSLAVALSYADDFLKGAPGAYEIYPEAARYWYSARLDILVTQLQATIYTVICFPPAGFEIAEAGEVDQLEYFRGWIIQYHEETHSWTVLAASQEVGIDEFKRLRKLYKGG